MNLHNGLFVVFLEAKEIKDGEKNGVYWQIAMPLFIDNRDVCFVFERNPRTAS